MSTPNDAPSMPATAERGLSRAEVEARVESGRTNKVKDSTSRSLAEIIRANVFTLFNGIILAAMVLVLITGSWRDAVFGCVIIINTGIAGAVHHDLKVLDVVISRELCYHDFNARFLCDYPPYIDDIHASELMVESAVEAFQQIDHGSSCCFVGKIATGDQFIESAEVKNKIVEEHHPMCVEMEGAAIGHTCCVNDIPFVIIRTMSDNADEEAAESATNFEETAARHSAGIVMQMLSSAR